MQEIESIVIREYQKEDINAIRALAKSYFEEDIIQIIDQSNTVFAYTALLETEIVGTLFAWKSAFHPYCTYVRMFEKTSIQYEYGWTGLYQVLMEQLKECGVDHLPLQTSMWETSLGVRSLYERHHWQEIRRTYEPVLHVGHVAVHEKLRPEGTIKTIASVALNEQLKNHLVELVQQNYIRTHMDNPVSGSLDNDVWEQLIFADDLIQNGSYVCVDADHTTVLAYSLLHESDQTDTFELGWCGGLHQEYEGMIVRLVQQQVMYAQKHGVSKILGEFDTTDEAAVTVMQSFPFDPCQAWVTYQLNRM